MGLIGLTSGLGQSHDVNERNHTHARNASKRHGPSCALLLEKCVVYFLNGKVHAGSRRHVYAYRRRASTKRASALSDMHDQGQVIVRLIQEPSGSGILHGHLVPIWCH